MIDWFRPLLMMFHAPTRGMSEVRDRAPLGSALLLAVLVQSAHSVYALWEAQSGDAAGLGGPLLIGTVLVQSIGVGLLVGIIFVPITIFASNLFERRGSVTLALQQGKASLVPT